MLDDATPCYHTISDMSACVCDLGVLTHCKQAKLVRDSQKAYDKSCCMRMLCPQRSLETILYLYKTSASGRRFGPEISCSSCSVDLILGKLWGTTYLSVSTEKITAQDLAKAGLYYLHVGR